MGFVPSSSGVVSLLKVDVRLFRKLLYPYLPVHLFNVTFGGVQQFMRIQKGKGHSQPNDRSHPKLVEKTDFEAMGQRRRAGLQERSHLLARENGKII